MANICESVYTFTGNDKELNRLYTLMAQANQIDITLADVCQAYFDSVPASEIQYNRSSVEYVILSDKGLEVGINSAWKEPAGVFEHLIQQLKLDSVKFCYYAVEPAGGYAHRYAETLELERQLPKYYFECYFPGEIWEDVVAYSLGDVTKLYNETLREIEDDEKGALNLAEYLSTAETEEGLLECIHNLNEVFQKEGYEYYCSLLRFTSEGNTDE